MAGCLSRFGMDLKVSGSLSEATALEKSGELEAAASIYEQIIKTKTLEEQPYDRLMIIYRKLKQPADELRVIKTAIAVFESIYLRKSQSRKLNSLSQSLMKSSGLANARGKLLYYPEPLNKWQKRKTVVEKKLKD